MIAHLRHALKAAFAAAKTVKATLHSPQNLNVQQKMNSADLVTLIDKNTEEAIFSYLRSVYPDHVYVGEESLEGSVSLDTELPTWIVDPIDGTTNFIHGFPFACISIGMAIKNIAVVGVVYHLDTDNVYFAAEGYGSFHMDVSSILDLDSIDPQIKDSELYFSLGTSTENPAIKIQPIKLDANSTLPLPSCFSSLLVSTEYGASQDPKHVLAKLGLITRLLTTPTLMPRGIRSTGSAALSMCLIARGLVDIYYEFGIHCWDICAGVVIVREAGGFVGGLDRHHEGEKFDLCGRSVLAVRPSKINDSSVGNLGILMEVFMDSVEKIEYERD